MTSNQGTIYKINVCNPKHLHSYISKGSKGPNCIDGKSDGGSNWEEERNTVLATAHLYVIKYMQVVAHVWSKLVRFSNTNCPNHPHYPPPIKHGNGKSPSVESVMVSQLTSPFRRDFQSPCLITRWYCSLYFSTQEQVPCAPAGRWEVCRPISPRWEQTNMFIHFPVICVDRRFLKMRNLLF